MNFDHSVQGVLLLWTLIILFRACCFYELRSFCSGRTASVSFDHSVQGVLLLWASIILFRACCFYELQSFCSGRTASVSFWPLSSVGDRWFRACGANMRIFKDGKYVFFISDWEWDKFLSHKKKRLRIRNKQNVASCCDLHNHPKNSFGCKGTIFNRG